MRKYNSHGFTLIELLVVVAIIGVLAAIAIPQFSGYRVRSFDARSMTDLHNAAVAEEAYFADFAHYVACDNVAGCKAALPSMSNSPDVALSITVSAAGDSFSVAAFHPQGAHNTRANAYVWNSDTGGLQ